MTLYLIAKWLFVAFLSKQFMLSNIANKLVFFAAAYAVMRCLSVCLSRSYILSKRVLISSDVTSTQCASTSTSTSTSKIYKYKYKYKY